MPMVSYRCPDCGADDEHFYHSAADAPASLDCRGLKMSAPAYKEIQREVANPDGTVTVEIEKVELAPTLDLCGGTAMQRVSLPGEMWARPARGFEPLVIYERANYESLPDDQKRSLNRFYVPGRNNEPTEPGMKRIEITSIAQYNQEIKRINEYETQQMRDHREMHRVYWSARRRAMRDDVNARIRHSPLLVALARMARAHSDRKSAVRYGGRNLDAKFHAQLIEFDQGKIQDWCDADTGWKSRRAR